LVSLALPTKDGKFSPKTTKAFGEASVNPVSQWGSGIPVYFTKGLATGLVWGKRAFNSPELPVLSEAFKFIIFCKPS
jgi:hypothetical protein